MALTIYGSPYSRTLRVLWAAAELGVSFEHVPLSFDDPALKQADFLRINPSGAIPAIVDDGFALSESLAINLYLATKYGSGGDSPLYPADLRDEAEIWRWTLWAQVHLATRPEQYVRLANLRQAIGTHAR
jgi:glutathione S-transferase